MSVNSHYDHNKKAGNQGDICKHPALIAALDETVVRTAQSPFRYADIFAGYAVNPLLKGNEWRFGIGKVCGPYLLKGNKHVALWAKWAGLKDAPYVGGVYPGSAWFARKVCVARGGKVELSLWETGTEPFNSLKKAFSRGHHIFNRAATPNDTAVKNADFVFIDPPDKTHWPHICDLVRSLDENNQSLLIWLPVGVNTTKTPVEEDSCSGTCRKKALEDLRLGVTKIRWNSGGRTIGCQLFYYRRNSVATKALRSAVEEIVAHAKWKFPVEHWPS